jgi:hypothetical protein
MGISTDPRDESFLKVCFVCAELAKPEQNHSPHYGGIVCLSCRAFFRRAYQKTRYPKYLCKSSGRCQITFKTRRHCQRCRYEKCLFSGMSPEAVLSEDQKQIRFRKLLHKRRINAQSESSSSSTDFSCKQEPVEYEDHSVLNEVKQISEYLGNIKSESALFVPIQKPFSGQTESVPTVAQDSDFVTRVLLNIRKNLGSIAEEIHSIHEPGQKSWGEGRV